MATIPLLTRTTREGILVDRGAAQAWSHLLERKLFRLLRLWNRDFASYDPAKTRDLQRLFYSEWGLPIQRSAEGISVDELACMRLKVYTETTQRGGEEPWQTDMRFSPRVFDLLLAIRQTSKHLGTYAQPVALGEQTRVHPEYLPAAKDEEHDTRSKSKGNTSTGRLVAYNPNIQNQPKRSRYLYAPSRPDLAFLQADYVRAEPHVMAYTAHDKTMIEDLKSEDLYTRLKERIEVLLGKSGVLTRKTCKNVFLAGQYLAGANKVSEMILKQDHVYIDPKDCKAILNGIARTYFGVAAMKQFLVQQCEVKGYVTNPFGRTRFFYDGRGPAAVDFWPQSTVGDIMWCVMRDVDTAARKLGGRFVLQVHDSILVEVPGPLVGEMAREMERIMTRRFDCVAPGFRIPVDFEAAPPGLSWGHVTHYEMEHA
jgi:DNA polymerase I-like protein with 3'-5' exonuclease and polymerase domains